MSRHSEICFLVEEAVEGGYNAQVVLTSIFTQAASLEELHANVRDAVRCHFEPEARPVTIRLQFIREEVIAA